MPDVLGTIQSGLKAVGDAGSRAGETVTNWVKNDIKDLRQASDMVSVASNIAKATGHIDDYRNTVQKGFSAIGLGDTQPDYNASTGSKLISTGNAVLTVLPIPVAGSGIKAVGKGAAKVAKMIPAGTKVAKAGADTIKHGKEALKSLTTLKNWKLTPRTKEVMTNSKGEVIYKPRYMGQPRVPRTKTTDWRQRPYNREWNKSTSRFERSLDELNTSMNEFHRLRREPSIRQGIKDIRKGSVRLTPAATEAAADYEKEDRAVKKKKK